ncbi:MAG: hypothetical protein ACM3IH_03350 [Sphingobacteriales bacterium]
MSDLVERLRAFWLPSVVVYEAADEIERLRIERDTISKPLHAEIERLRAALVDIIGNAHAHYEQEPECWYVPANVLDRAEKLLEAEALNPPAPTPR